MKNFLLFILLPLVSFAANTHDTYRMCLNASNKLESPADRDAEKINCFNQSRVRTSVDSCLSLARVMEHTTSSDSLVLGCLNDNILRIKIDECVRTAKKLYYSENRDKALWSCLENHTIKRTRCKTISDEMTFPHNRNVALNYCLMKN